MSWVVWEPWFRKLITDTLWARAAPLFWRQEKPSPHHNHSQVCVCFKDVWKLMFVSPGNHFQHALIRFVIAYVPVQLVWHLPLPSNAPLYQLECKGEAEGRIQHCHKQKFLLQEVNSLLKKITVHKNVNSLKSPPLRPFWNSFTFLINGPSA